MEFFGGYIQFTDYGFIYGIIKYTSYSDVMKTL